ncbi:unnamed protein product [Rhodiola kirilowii]
MGCVPSKLFQQELKQQILLNNGGNYINHVVSLTFSTYGVLNLDSDMSHQMMQGDWQSDSQPDVDRTSDLQIK